MQPADAYCSADEVARNAECLLGRVEEVRRVLRQKGLSEYAIDQAVTAVYQSAMPYITGKRICLIENRRAWVFRVAIRAAWRAAIREVRCHSVAPATLASTAARPEPGEALFDLHEALIQLTDQQRAAVELCVLGGQSLREAAASMGISVGTLCSHLSAGKKRLEIILARYKPKKRSL